MGELFPDVLSAMKHLLIGGAMPDQADLIHSVGQVHPFLYLFVLMFVLLASLTVINMLVGVLCEVVSVVSAVEKETLLVNFVEYRLKALLAGIGFEVTEDNKITREDFDRLLQQPEAARILQDMGV